MNIFHVTCITSQSCSSSKQLQAMAIIEIRNESVTLALLNYTSSTIPLQLRFSAYDKNRTKNLTRKWRTFWDSKTGDILYEKICDFIVRWVDSASRLGSPVVWVPG